MKRKPKPIRLPRRKPADQRRESRLEIRLTAAEAEALNRQADEQGVPIAEILRQAWRVSRAPNAIIEGTREG